MRIFVKGEYEIIIGKSSIVNTVYDIFTDDGTLDYESLCNKLETSIIELNDRKGRDEEIGNVVITDIKVLTK